ncbi:DUF3450 domain-containing protein [Kushneria aurantia]|uniref:DUF3450 domain-containing protein n=1 Tax=Kushneria aurantia TaxID=504092 RepID=A0ABV6G8V9_9GAMM|nr:DUF3450 domain-containing protein [Kushneria aurantia]
MALPAHASENASDSLVDESIDAQQQQSEIQRRIDSADDETQALIEQLRSARDSAQRLERYNQQLATTLNEQQARIERQQQALDSLDETRAALPDQLTQMVSRLRALVEADMPFRRDERLARLDSLEQTVTDTSIPAADRLEQLLSVWRTELNYGREMDSWRGRLVGTDSDREVQYLRVGRVGFYYLSPNGQQGGVWQSAEGQWQPLDSSQRSAVGQGIRIANEQRSPELLSLPLSVEIRDGRQRQPSAPQQESSS